MHSADVIYLLEAAGVLALLVLIFAGVIWALVAASRRARRIQAEIDAAPPLLPLPALTGIDLTGAHRLISEFDGLRTFQDVDSWDRRALDVAMGLERQAAALTAFLTEAPAAIKAARGGDPVTNGRVDRARAAVVATSNAMATIGALYSDLMERVDMTPNTAAEQRAVLKELRGERKELQLKKREAKAEMTAVRQEGRDLSAHAGHTTTNSFFLGQQHHYNAAQAAHERRVIRRARETLLQPMETGVAAIERQLVALERRITWVARFGDDGDG